MKIFNKEIKANFILYFTGFAALLWFLIRVIPKPSRAAYPCQRAAFPIASAFVIYIMNLLTSSFAFRYFKKHWNSGNSIIAAVFLVITLINVSFLFQSDKPYTYANYKSVLEGPNQPIGMGKGIFPGRVVWIHDSTAVNQQCTNSDGDYWWMDDNADQNVINKMVSDALQKLTGKETDAEAWNAIFRYYNANHNKGNTGYKTGEKIVIKLNLNNGSADDSVRSDPRPLDTSPQIIYAVLDQLINVVKVAQADISFGDPGKNTDNIYWNKFHHIFPDVKYWGSGKGRTPIIESDKPELYTSDGTMELHLPTCYLEAAYMINIPVLKQHHRGGISLCSKNHFGTFVPFLGNAFSLHYSLPCPQGNGDVENGGYGAYRIFVDFIGHKDMGGKTILYLIDGLWSSTNWGDPPWKWRMAPFNNSYPASIFVSQDPVAIESVGFDFLYNEFYVGNPSGNEFPHYSGVDDFLHQAADSINWPKNILYDPERDGSYLPRSMGVHEHWNNAGEKKYSRNLGADKGIEFIQVQGITSVDVHETKEKTFTFILENNFPNPFNPGTTIRYRITKPALVMLKIYNINGEKVRTLVNQNQNTGVYDIKWDGRDDEGQTISSGIYFYQICVNNFSQAKKMILIK